MESTPTWLIGPEIPAASRIGTILNGTYRLDAFLGQGMTGTSYNAWHLRQKSPYAIKLLHRQLALSHERVIHLRHDLRALASLGRYGFLPVDLSFAPDGAPFLAAELLVGETLRQRLLRGPLPALVAGKLVAQVADAMERAHKLGVVHGDLRPENIFLPSVPGREALIGQPILLDAALHHLRRRPIGLDESLPLSKLAYLAPEQASGEVVEADIAGDIFALGAILWECLTGKQSFGGKDMEMVLEKLSCPPPPLVLCGDAEPVPGLSHALDVITSGACARQPEARVQSMGALLEALAHAFAGCDLPLPPRELQEPSAQHRAARRSTLAMKKVVPLRAALSEQPAAGEGRPGPARSLDEDLPVSAREAEILPLTKLVSDLADAGTHELPTRPPRRPNRPTVRARDLSKLLADVRAGLIEPAKAVLLAGEGEELPSQTQEDADQKNGHSHGMPEAEDPHDRLAVAREQVAQARRKVLDAAQEDLRSRIREMEEQRQTSHTLRAEQRVSAPIPKVSPADLSPSATTPVARPAHSADSKTSASIGLVRAKTSGAMDAVRAPTPESKIPDPVQVVRPPPPPDEDGASVPRPADAEEPPAAPSSVSQRLLRHERPVLVMPVLDLGQMVKEAAAAEERRADPRSPATGLACTPEVEQIPINSSLISSAALSVPSGDITAMIPRSSGMALTPGKLLGIVGFTALLSALVGALVVTLFSARPAPPTVAAPAPGEVMRPVAEAPREQPALATSGGITLSAPAAPSLSPAQTAPEILPATNAAAGAEPLLPPDAAGAQASAPRGRVRPLHVFIPPLRTMADQPIEVRPPTPAPSPPQRREQEARPSIRDVDEELRNPFGD